MMQSIREPCQVIETNLEQFVTGLRVIVSFKYYTLLILTAWNRFMVLQSPIEVIQKPTETTAHHVTIEANRSKPLKSVLKELLSGLY